MSGLLMLATVTPGGGLSRSDREAITAARQLAGALGVPWDAGLVGDVPGEAASAAAGAGAERVFAVHGDDFLPSRYETDAAAFEAICRKVEPEYVLAAESARMHRALPGVAYRLGGAVDTHVCGWEKQEAGLVVQRWFYRQRILGRFTREKRPWFLLVDGGVVEPWSGTPREVRYESVPVEVSLDGPATTVEGIRDLAGGEQTIRPDAELLFVAGAGWTKKQADGKTHVAEAEAIIKEFLRLSQASLGGSKSVVDQSQEGQESLSFMTHLHQVGQTGSTPRHPKGLATCCHGEEPHVVGWRFIRERRAVNLDPGCGWAHGKADVLYVADAFEVMAKVNELLRGA